MSDFSFLDAAVSRKRRHPYISALKTLFKSLILILGRYKESGNLRLGLNKTS